MRNILSYFYFTGETIDGDLLELETPNAITEKAAKAMAIAELEEWGGGHLDAFFAETDEFAFDVEV